MLQRLNFSSPRPNCSKPVGLRWISACAVLALVSPLSADETVLQIQDAQVVVGESGVHGLTFNIQRANLGSDGAVLRVETAKGGDNPAVPGQAYTPIPTGTEVILPPGIVKTSVDVEVFGAPAGDDATMLLRVTDARAYHPQPRLTQASERLAGICCDITSMIFADLNGDGHADIVTGNGSTGTLSVLLADGEGGYGDPEHYPLPELHLYAVSLAAGDVNGNGHLDVIAAEFHSRAVAVFFGDGTSGLSEPQTFYLGPDLLWPSDIALADVTGNGHLDIITANLLVDGGDESLSVLEGDGAGGFAKVDLVPALGHKANAIAVADVTGNGHPDIVVSNVVDGDLTLLAGEGPGSFAAPISLDIGQQLTPQAIVLADVTGNGHADIVTANETESLWPDPSLPAWVSILEGQGTGIFADAMQFPIGPGFVRQMTAGDLVGKGHMDIAVARLNPNDVTVLFGEGQGGFSDPVHLPVNETPFSVELHDVSGNGHLDLVVGGHNDVIMLPNRGAGNIDSGSHYPTGRRPYAVVATDLTGDGYPDIATANSQANTVSVLLHDGSGGFAEAVDYPVQFTPLAIRAADVSGDGIPDLLTLNAFGSSVSVLIGDAAGGFADAVHYPVSDEWISPFAMAVGDVTGNDHPDIVTANTHQLDGRDYLSLLINNGDGTFAPPVTLSLGEAPFHYPEAVLLADVNGNGHLDIVTANFFSNNLSFLVGDGQGNFNHAGYLESGPTPVAVAAGDVTGDGHIDLLVVNTSAHAVSVLQGDGAGNFAAPVSYSVGPVTGEDFSNPWPTGLALADITGDGHADIVVTNTNIGAISVLANNGEGEFPAFELFTTGVWPRAPAVADFTGDGNADVVTANQGSDSVTLLSNRLSRVVLPDPEAVGTIIYGISDILFEDRFEQ